MKETYTSAEAVALLNKGQKIYTDAIMKHVHDPDVEAAIALDVLKGVVDLSREILLSE